MTETTAAPGAVSPSRPRRTLRRTLLRLAVGAVLIAITVTVVAAIEPTTTGVVRVAGFRIRYHHGPRNGDEQSGLDIVIRASAG